MGFCEQRLVYEKRLGERLTREQASAIAEGNYAHKRFFNQARSLNASLESSQKERWCFIANAVFGRNAPETIALRLFRDECLRHSRFGRRFIIAYYEISPGVARWLSHRPLAAQATRLMLRTLIRLVDSPRWRI